MGAHRARERGERGLMEPVRVSLTEAKSQWGRWLARVQAGEEIILTRRGEPAARLVPQDRS